MFILNAESKGYSQKAVSQLKQLGTVSLQDLERQNLLQHISEADVLIVRLRTKIDKEILDNAKKLHTIVTATTGLNHIDTAYAQQKGITILSLKGEQDFLKNVTATAELTFGLMLALLRRIPSAFIHVCGNGWQRDLFKGNEAKGKTIGIIGFGRLGHIMAEYAHAFKMNVLIADPHVEQSPEWCEKVSLRNLLSMSDIISLHVQLDETTNGFLGEKEFSLMKRGAIFLNTSRGELVDEKALLNALESNQLSGAGLDVVTNETSKKSDWIKSSAIINYAKDHDNVIITPHIGGATHESMEATELFMVQKLKAHLIETQKLTQG